MDDELGEGRLVIYIKDTDSYHETDLHGYWDGGAFFVPFQDDMTARECARIVAHGIVREAASEDAA